MRFITSPLIHSGHYIYLGADDRARTGDLDLGKVALYQLSYVRVVTQCSRSCGSNASRDREKKTDRPNL
jgi:hypothetical protein